MAARGPLRVLLLPLDGQPPMGLARARLSRAREALAAAGEAELRLSGLRLSGLRRGRGGQDGAAAGGGGGGGAPPLPGAWRDFLWESMVEEDPAVAGETLRLLAVREACDLLLYEVQLDATSGSADNVVLLTCCCQERLETLMQQHLELCQPPVPAQGFSTASSLRLLAFKKNRALLLINNCLIARLALPGGGLEEEELEEAFLLQVPPQAAERIVDVAFCRGVLFLLDASGWMYLFDATDGASLAKVSLSLYQAEGRDEDWTDVPHSLMHCSVSHDLSVAVIVNCSNHVAVVDLNQYFREYPEHLLCQRNPDNLPMGHLEGTDEDDLRSSDYSGKSLQQKVRTDRSWKAHLSSLYDTTGRVCTSNLSMDVSLPWYQHLLHIEDHDWRMHRASGMSLLEDALCVLSNSGAIEHQRTSKMDRSWKHICPGVQKGPVKLECKSVTSYSALFATTDESEGLSLLLWDLETQETTRSCVGKNATFVECAREDQLCLILSELGLSLLLFDLTQEEFLNRLIIHGSAGTVDSLCRLNGWGRCSIPIQALEAGLENRQLDTVDFFLKNKENLFSPSSTCSLEDQPDSFFSEASLKRTQELRPALDLLCMAIQENDSEAQSKHFSEQLLNLTLSFLNRQLCEIFLHTEELDSGLERCVDILNSYVTKLRTFMIRFPHQPRALSDPCEPGDDVPRIQESERWEKMDTEQTIAEAVLCNKLPEAQAFFRMTSNPAQNLEELIRVGLELVYRRLLKRDIAEASKLLRNMGFSVMELLHQICFYTTDWQVRDFLVNILQEGNYFSEAEEDMIDFVYQVENAYSKASQKNETAKKSSFWGKDQDLPAQAATLDAFLRCSEEMLPCGDHRMMFSWAQWWDPDVRERIRLALQPPREFKTCNPEVLWTYLTSWHDWENISSWCAASQNQEPTLSWPALSMEAIDQRTFCSRYLRNEILDHLSRNGSFVPADLEDFESLLQRLALAGGVMQTPHPVPVCPTASGLDFHDRFVRYCLERGLDFLLYTYLDYYGLFSPNCAILNDKELHEVHPWFEFLVRCRGIASSRGDAKTIFQASLANAQILIPSNQASVSTMLLEGRTLLALATTMYAPGGMDQVLQNGEVGEKVDAQLFRMALAPYSKLRAALFPPSSCHGTLPSDISLYHLVQSLLPFDPTKLFGWQSANTLAIPDICIRFPHFSCSTLVNKYAVAERLDFLYYLRHARPSFAFGTFLIQQLAKSKAPKHLIQQAGKEASRLALTAFYVPPVAVASVCFLELLGLDSFKLRVDIQAANVILDFMSQRDEPQHNSIRQSLVEKLSELAEESRTAAEELLVCLEEAVWDSIEHQAEKMTSSAIKKQWSLVVQFCRLHNLKLSLSYLKMCARSNAWMQFLVEAQVCSYLPNEVVPVIQEFLPPLQSHLRLAFRSLASSSVQGETCSDPLSLPRPSPTQPSGTNCLFHVLLQAQEKPPAWHYLLGEAVKHHAPVLSVLAACLQDACIISCLCVGILTSLDSSTAVEVTRGIEGSVETHDWGLQDLTTLWQSLLKRQKVRTLLQGFRLFLKDSPLLLILEMYELCMVYKNYTSARAKLLSFQAELLKLQAAPEAPPPGLPVPWLQSQATFLLEEMLLQCRTQYELCKLLQLLADAALPSRPDMKKLSALSLILKDSPISVSRAILSNYTPENFQNECQRILGELQGRSAFALARHVAELAELPVDNLAVQEVMQNLKLLKQIGHWPRKRTRIEFWKKSHENYTIHGISSRAASDFFLAQADLACASLDNRRTSGVPERQLLLTLAGHWLAQSDPVPLDELEGIEKEIWRCRIAEHSLSQSKPGFTRQISLSGELSFESLTKEFSFSRLAALNAPKYLQLDGLPPQGASPAALAAPEAESLASLIGSLLDEGSVHEASRVCRYFRFFSRDVLLVLQCRALAAGEAPQGRLHPDIEAVLAKAEEGGYAEKRGEGDSQAKPRDAPGAESSSPLKPQDPGREVAGRMLQALIAECVHGRHYCRQVLCLYELSKELGCSFDEISAHDPEKLLRAILASPQPDRCKKAQAFITTQGLRPETVADLVAEEITQELLAPLRGKRRQREILNPADESQAFLQLAKLCQDHTLVGMKLLDKISSVPRGELACTTELLILAHNCFSLTCHMEGIARVLQAARLLTEEHLAPNEEYGLVVRLLTGIGRYNEMTYIFDLLHEKHYFEVLMRKKLDPSGTLKTALLDYIKRCRPGDSEKHNMIALCFSMCREIGENHEAAANVQLKLIESQPWEESLQDVPNLKKLLMKALTLFIDAAESYSKDFCVRQALRCNRLTKLITLQLHFLNGSRRHKLINLDKKTLLECIMALPRFYQAAIVAEAYEFLPDWADVLYQQVILKGDFNYLEEYKQRGLLKTSTFEEIARKFQRHTASEAALRNLKKLLTYCDDLYVHYKLAYDHQFHDAVTVLLRDSQAGCCLNDLLTN